MVLAISHIIFIFTFLLNLIAKKIKFLNNKSLLPRYTFLKKFFYNVSIKNEYKFTGFKFRDLYKFKKYSSLSIESVCICILVFIKNYVHTNVQSKWFKVGIWMNFILIKNKNTYFNQTYLIGSADSLTFFSNKLKLNSNQVLVYNYYFKQGLVKSTIIKHNFISFLKNHRYFKNLTTSFINLSEKKTIWESNFLPTSIDKFSTSQNLKISKTAVSNLILFLRKSKIFNKGRYSRNRQYYRTGVYWCIYINVILVIGLYFWFYRFTMNFSYMWWSLYLFLGSFIFIKLIRLKFYNFTVFFKNLKQTKKWTGSIMRNIFKSAYNLIKKFVLNLNKFYYISYYNNQIRYRYFVELFVYPIFFFFIFLRSRLTSLVNGYVNVEYDLDFYKSLDYYYLHQNRFFFIKSSILNFWLPKV